MEEPIVTALDAALHELGMLSTVTDSRREYLKEQNRNSQSNRVKSVDHKTLGVLHFMNTKFVTMVNMSSHKRVNMSSSKREFMRFQPYTTPMSVREERIRTKSENSDVDTDWLFGSTFTPLMPSTPDCSGLYKSRSLEDVKVTVSDETVEDHPAPEVESVSDKIQQLQVSE